MSDSFLWVDGNALAGLLQEVFGADMTLAMRRCQSCGTRSMLGAHLAYRGAGAVLRCPACGDMALRIATLNDRHVVHMAGELTLEVPSR
jgi:predicted RNA-binding Zn-ribbon protein involved in translation (DUF1610 family)